MTAETIEKKQRLFSIDVLRFIAIFLVTGFHCLRFVNRRSFNMLMFPPSLHAFQVGALGVEIFFIVAAFCLCLSWDKLKDPCKIFFNRLKRVLPVYYVAIFSWIILIHMGVAVKPAEAWDIIAHCLCIHNLFSATFPTISGVFWFIGAIFDFYLVFLVFGHRFLKSNKFWIIFSFICFLSAHFINLYTGYSKHVLNHSILVYMPCFACGILLYNKKFDFKCNIINYVLLAAGVYLLCFVDNIAFNQFFGTKLNLYGIVVASLLAVSIYNIIERIQSVPYFIKNPINLVATSSFSIYLYNYIFNAYNSISPKYIYIYIFQVFGFGLLMYYLVEKNIYDSAIFKKITYENFIELFRFRKRRVNIK